MVKPASSGAVSSQIHSGLITDGAFTGWGIGTEATEDTIFSGKNMQLIDDADLVDTYLDNDEHFE
jgi:hypothetical protein